MAVRIKDWIIPYTWWQWIEITNNHVINVLLREMNNLIMVNEDRELYVDLQLPDWIEPDDDFPVWVTTGKILQEDWWQESGIILNRKTTSWDYVRLIYATDWKLYYDPWTWQWIEIWAWYSVSVATASSLWVIKLGSDTQQTESAQTPTATAWRTYAVQLNANNQAVVNVPRTDTTYTAWNNISIVNGEISATLPNALVYKWSVTDLSDLQNIQNPTVWDTYFVEWEDWMYSRDGTQWSYVWWTGIDTSMFFNKTIDTSDDITEWSVHLFCTAIEKAYWNWKQDALTAGTGIDITSNVVSNTLPFNPENEWVLAQVLKKTSTGYRWANETAWFDPENVGSTGQVLKKTATGYAWANESWGWGWWWWTSYTAGDGIAITGHVISNTKPFEPWTWTAWQVLTKTADGYVWSSAAAGDSNVKLFPLNSLQDTTNAQDILDWTLAWKMPIIKYNSGVHDAYYCLERHNATTGSLEFRLYMWPWQWDSWRLTFQEYENIFIQYSWTSVTDIDWEKEELNKVWIWTQTQFDQLWSYENWVIYNILPNS